MKKIFTSLSSLAFTSCLLCFSLLFSTNITGQIVLTTDDANNGKKIIECTSTAQLVFTDDGTIDGLYQDNIARLDTIILCPTDTVNNQIKVTFTSFGIANGDELRVYDCNLSATTCSVKATATGQGVSSAFGGWVQATCDRSVNPSGCLSFVFSVNGDGTKDKGWEGWISCENDKAELTCPADISVTDECNSLDGRVMVTIPKPTITSCDGSTNPMVILTSTCAIIPNGAVVADGSDLGTFNLPMGRHTITATSVSDPTLKCTYDIIVDQPTIVCNDKVIISGGFNCPSRISVDDIIENPCVGAGTTYRLEIDLGYSKGGVISAIVDATSLATLQAGGIDFSLIPVGCQTEYPISVTRIVKFNDCAGTLDSLTKICSSIFQISEERPSFIINTTSIVACNSLTDDELKERLDIAISCNTNPDSVKVEITKFSGNLCGTAAIVDAHITLVSYCGTSSLESITLNVERPSSFFPPSDTIFSCSSTLDPEMTGFPLIDTDGDGVGDLEADNDCDYFAVYSDTRVIDKITSQSNIQRTWTILDRCNLEPNVTLAPQLIEITGGKPIVACPTGLEIGSDIKPILLLTERDECERVVVLTPPTATDDCSGTLTITKVRTINRINNHVHPANDTILPVGQYYTQFVAINDTTGIVSDTCQIYFTVSQPGSVEANCVDELNVSFVGEFVTVSAADIDGSRSDNECVIYTKEIRKEDGEWGSQVNLTCSDVANNIKVYLRATGPLGEQNTCWTWITGKDTSPPVCTDLEDMEFVCEDFHAEDFGLPTDANFNKNFDEEEWGKLTPDLLDRYNEFFGNPICTDNLSACFQPIILQQYQLIPASCGETKIKRQYAAFDESGNFTEFKEQLITVTFEQDFTVTFPADWEGECGADFPEADLDLVTKGCTVLGWTHKDKRYNNVNGACYLLERTYTVNNWCSYDANGTTEQVARTEDEHGFAADKTVTSEIFANIGRFTYTQILKVSDNDAPVIIVEPIEECLTNEICQEEKIFTISAGDCAGEEGLVYNYELAQNGTILQSGEGKTFSATVTQGTYEVKWTVNDNCSNTGWETISYTFKDCKNPTPYCLDGVAINIAEDTKSVVVWTSDLTQNSTDNCTDADKLEYRLWHRALGATATKPASTDNAAVVLALPKNVALTCDYLGTQAINVYVVDQAGNWDFCIASIDVQDNNQVCDSDNVNPSGMAAITGQITSTTGLPMKEVILSVSSENTNQTISTDENGQYELALPKNKNYSIDFDKESSLTNGVSVFDLVLISKHILGVQKFDTPYKFFAADVNQSASITAFDMVILRQIILGLKTEFEQSTNWRFIKENHEFTTNNPLDEGYVEKVAFPDLDKDISAMDFIAVKSGDINGNVKIDGFAQAEPRNTARDLIIDIQDKAIKRGDIVEVALEMENLKELQGFQYGLKFTNLSLSAVSEGILGASNYAQKGADGLAIIWNNETGAKEATTLLKLQLVANKNGLLSEFIQLSNDLLASEAIDKEDQFLDVKLNFQSSTNKTTTQLFQNTPNPFKESTIIGFELSKPSPIVFEVFNLQGVRLKTITGDFEKGYHELKIQQEELNNSGVLWYRIKTLDGIYSKKMLILD